MKFFVKSGSRYRVASPSEVCEAATAYVFEQANKTRPALASPRASCELLRNQAGLDVEHFGAVFLDKRHRLIAIEIMFTGTIDGASVHPREIVKRTLALGAAAVVIFHNHPSMNAEPSQSDEIITTRIKDALALIDVRLLDHIIVAGLSAVSLAERGLL